MEIAGEIHPKSNTAKSRELEALPSVIIQAGIEYTQEGKSVNSNDLNTETLSGVEEDESSLQDMLESIDSELRGAKTKVRSYQEMALKHQSNTEIFAKLNTESRFYQDKYDDLIRRREAAVDKLKILRRAQA